MNPSPALCAFIAQLRQGTIAPLPEDEQWKDHVERISVPGRIAEVTEDSSSQCTSCHTLVFFPLLASAAPPVFRVELVGDGFRLPASNSLRLRICACKCSSCMASA